MKDEGKHPEDGEEFTREVMKGRISGVIAWRRDEGIGSRARDSGRAMGEEELGNLSVCEGRE